MFRGLVEVSPLAVCLFIWISSAIAFLVAAQETLGADEQDGVAVPFLRVGDGTCLAQGGLPVQGRSRRDVNHTECRHFCNAGCIGYSYRPCELQCIVHGDPATFLVSDAGAWTALSGGSRIDTTSGSCGAGCFARMTPCQDGTVESSGVTVAHQAFAFDSTQFVDCTRPFFGTLELHCGLNGVGVISGRCKKPCPPGTVLDGSFEVSYTGIVHGSEIDAPCPPGVSGTITMGCVDGVATKDAGGCGFNCKEGAVPVGRAALMIPNMHHLQQITKACPTNFSGLVTVSCQNGFAALISGSCLQMCVAGQNSFTVGALMGFAPYPALLHGKNAWAPCLPLSKFAGLINVQCSDGQADLNTSIPDSACYTHCAAGLVGPGVKAVNSRAMQHDTNATVACAYGFTGDLIINCWNGTVKIVQGECLQHCFPGTITSNAVTMPYDFLQHGVNVTLQCPTDYRGSLLFKCIDGTMTLLSGFCGHNCAAGIINNNGAIMDHPALNHSFQVNLTCPAGYLGSVIVRCYDGSIRPNGFCGAQCGAGSKRVQGALAFYPLLNHTQVYISNCVAQYGGLLTYSGKVKMTCNDSVVTPAGFCYPDCPRSTIKNAGISVSFPLITSGNNTTSYCDPGTADTPTNGIVTLACLEGLVRVIGGSCGQPCPMGIYSSVYTRLQELSHDLIWHNSQSWFLCPEAVSGKILLKCLNMVKSRVDGSCGERCLPTSLKITGVSFVSPLLEHLEVYVKDCTNPFEGNVTLFCDSGVLNVTNNCRSGCLSGSALVSGGTRDAIIPYPNMRDSTLFTTQCPLEDHFVGTITLVCSNGSPHPYNGSCDSYCRAGRFIGRNVQVTYYQMEHNETQDLECPGGFTGMLSVQCSRGTVVQIGGDCFQDCRRGAKAIRPGVVMTWETAAHSTIYDVQICPTGFIGSVWLQCWDGLVSVYEGNCFANCVGGTTEDGAVYGNMIHNTNVTVACPQLGTLRLGCRDSEVIHFNGSCIYNCAAGSLKDEHNVSVQYPSMSHATNASGTCVGFTIGTRLLQCLNKVVTFAAPTALGNQCMRHCSAGDFRTKGGFKVATPDILHNQEADVPCATGILGHVQLRCYDALLTQIGGECGAVNCNSGAVTSGGARIAHGAIDNTLQIGGTCPTPFEGEVVLRCDNATVIVDEVSLYSTVPVYVPVSTAGGQSFSQAELGSDPYSNRIKLCECCMPPVQPPPAEDLLGKDMMAVVLWGSIASGVFFVAAVTGGVLIWRFVRAPRKLSVVFPAPDAWKGQPSIPRSVKGKVEPPSPKFREPWNGSIWHWW